MIITYQTTENAFNDTKAITLQKILQVLNGGGTGGGGGLGTQQVFEGRDPAPPDDVTKPAVNYPTGGGSLTQWNGAAWV